MNIGFLRAGTDADLVREALQDNPGACEDLILRHQKRAYAIARAILIRPDDAEDVVQNAFLQAFSRLGSLRDPAAFGPWLLTIVRNEARRAIRSSTSKVGSPLEEDRPAGSTEPVEAADFREHLWRRVEELPEGIREAIYLYYHDGESVRAVASALGIDRIGVKNRLRKGREILRGRLWREMEACLRDMLPSTREWKRRGRQLALVAVTVIPAGPSAAAASTGASLVPPIAHGPPPGKVFVGMIMSGKKIAILVGIALVVIVGGLALRDWPEGPDGPPGETMATTALADKEADEENGGAVTGSARDDALLGAARGSAGDEALPGTKTAVLSGHLAGRSEEHTIRGHVVDSDEKPVPGARVVSYTALGSYGTRNGAIKGGTSSSTETDKEGAFTFQDLLSAPPTADAAETTYMIGASKDDRGLGYTTGVPGGATDVIVTLQAACRVAGRVLDAETNQGIEGVVVEAVPQDQDASDRAELDLARLLAGRTDATGSYALQVLPERTYRISVREAGAYMVPPPFPMLLTPRAGEQIEEVDFLLRLGGSISGTVFDSEGVGVAAASVKLMGVSHGSFEESISGKDGSFEFRGLCPGGTYTLLARHEERGTSSPRSVVLPQVEEIGGVDLHLGGGHKIDGRVTTTDGQAVADLEVSLSTISTEGSRTVISSGGRGVVTDASGSFSFQDVGPGSYGISIGSGTKYSLLKNLTILMPPDEDLQGVEVVVRARTPGSISGRVVDEKGSSVAEAFVFAYSTAVPNIYASDRTDEDGGFGLEDLGGSETYTVLARKPGYMEVTATNVKVNSREIQVVLLRGGGIHGRIVSASGNPIESFEICIAERYDDERGSFRPTQDTWTEFRDPLGEFLKTDLEPGRVRLAARAKGYGISRTDGIEVRSGGTVELGDIPLGPGACVAGTVVSKDGKPLPGARIYPFKGALEPDSLEKGAGSFVMADGEGSFRLDNLTPGDRINLAARCDGFAAGAVMDIAVDLDPPAGASFVLVPEARLEGNVLEATRPAQRVSVFLEREGGPCTFRACSLTDAKGRYAMRGLPGGSYGVQVFKVTETNPPKATLQWEGKVEIAEGRKMDFDIVLEAK
jgi:RNA polymerase sigma factor (sigma-70 family)